MWRGLNNELTPKYFKTCDIYEATERSEDGKIHCLKKRIRLVERVKLYWKEQRKNWMNINLLSSKFSNLTSGRALKVLKSAWKMSLKETVALTLFEAIF